MPMLNFSQGTVNFLASYYFRPVLLQTQVTQNHTGATGVLLAEHMESLNAATTTTDNVHANVRARNHANTHTRTHTHTHTHTQ